MKSIAVLIAILWAPVVAAIAWFSGALTGLTQLWQIMLFAWPASIALAWLVFSLLLKMAPDGRPQPFHWSAVSKVFHWVMALCILATTALMYYMVNLGDLTIEENRAEYSRLLKTHKSLGLVILFLVVFRFVWNRTRERPPMPAGMSSLQIALSRISHWSFYGFMLMVPLLGWMASMTYGGRTFFFGLFELPIWLPKNIEWANVLQPAHIWAAWIMLGLVGIHILAALWHHFSNRDATLVQMLPKR